MLELEIAFVNLNYPVGTAASVEFSNTRIQIFDVHGMKYLCMMANGNKYKNEYSSSSLSISDMRGFMHIKPTYSLQILPQKQLQTT